VREEPAQRDTCALVLPRKPWDLSADERVVEMGELLALAFRRYRRKGLAEGRDGEPSCDRTVNSTKEVA
jgi:hypothetical protein